MATSQNGPNGIEPHHFTHFRFSPKDFETGRGSSTLMTKMCANSRCSAANKTQPPATSNLASHKVLSQWSLVPHHLTDHTKTAQLGFSAWLSCINCREHASAVPF